MIVTLNYATLQPLPTSSADPITGKKTPEKGLVMRVVIEAWAPFAGLNHVVYCDNFYSSAPLVDMLTGDKVFFSGTIKKCAKGFPDSLKKVQPRRSYASETVGSNTYFVFQDRKEVCFVTNVFPEHMDSQIARLQPEGVLRMQSVPPPLPAYNTFMGGVDRTAHIRKTYGFDRKFNAFG